MPKYNMEMILEWAKVFPENKDEGGDGNTAAKKVKKMGGQYSVNAYFTDQEQIDKLVQDGLDLMPMGNKRIKEGNSEFGLGQYMKLGRFHNNEVIYTDKNGKEQSVDHGGAPIVADLRMGVENKRHWSYEDDGLIWNGSKAQVLFETYSQGAGVRLIAIGITELAEPEDSYESVDDFTMGM